VLFNKALQFTQTLLHGPMVRRGYATLIIKLLNLFLVLLLNVLLARMLGAEELGIYAFAVSVVTILSIPAMAGLPALLVREVAKNQLMENWMLLKGVLARAFQFSFVLSTLIGIGVALSVWGVAESSQQNMQADVLLIALFLIPIIALSELRSGALRGFKKIIEAQIPEMLIRPFGFMCLIVIIATFGPVSAQDVVFAHVMAAATAFVVGSFFLFRTLPGQLSNIRPAFEQRRWFRSMLPLTILTGMEVVNGQADILILGILATSEEVGLYRIAMQGAALVPLGLFSVNMVLGPYIAQSYAAGNQEKLQKFATISCRVSVAIAVLVTVVLVGFGDTLLVVLFGEEFGGGYWALVILATGYLLWVCFGSVILLLTMTGHDKEAMKGALIGAVGNIILNIVLIPPFGMIGAAFATITSLLIWNTLLLRAVRKKLRIDSSIFYRGGRG